MSADTETFYTEGKAWLPGWLLRPEIEIRIEGEIDNALVDRCCQEALPARSQAGRVGCGKRPLIQRYRLWPLLSHNPCSGPDRGARHETPGFRRSGWMAIPPCARSRRRCG
jgi:hypothetical protein